jgi:thiosulfate dehydrogenase [quinone] large subunit
MTLAARTIQRPIRLSQHHQPSSTGSHDPSPTTNRRLADKLFRSTATAPLWLVVRVWLGYQWLAEGWKKLHGTGSASWFGRAPALRGFVHSADANWANRAHAFGHPAVHYAWFLNFLDFVGNHASVMGPVVVFSEILIGLGLITGVLTRWAASGGVMLNVMYVCAGSAGVNGLFIIAGVLLICADHVAGHLGGDRIIRHRLTTPRKTPASRFF